MSEKFVVGQWVTCDRCEEPGRIRWIEDAGHIASVEFIKTRVAITMQLTECQPFAWQIGKTYRTTLDGVTATIQAKTNKALYGQDSRPDSLSEEWAWDDRTGLLRGIEKVETAPHLLPHLADEPPPVAEAATYSEFADADECDEPTALQSLLTEFSHRREQCQRMAESWETKAAEWRKAEQMIVEAIERAKR